MPGTISVSTLLTHRGNKHAYIKFYMLQIFYYYSTHIEWEEARSNSYDTQGSVLIHSYSVTERKWQWMWHLVCTRNYSSTYLLAHRVREGAWILHTAKTNLVKTTYIQGKGGEGNKTVKHLVHARHHYSITLFTQRKKDGSHINCLLYVRCMHAC